MQKMQDVLINKGNSEGLRGNSGRGKFKIGRYPMEKKLQDRHIISFK